MKSICLIVMLGGMAWWLKQDVEVYRRFKALTATADRQRVFWRWIWQSFAVFVGASLVCLWLADGLSPFSPFPSAFEPLHQALGGHRPARSGGISGSMMVGIAIGLAIVIAVQALRLRKMLKPLEGPADALIPRNGQERAIALVLSVNAGVVEELFFRLALPLLLFRLTGSATIAFGLAVVGFGLAHAYQGWKGVAATMLAGGVLSLMYLAHGSLLRVMMIHAVIDILALIVRPAIVGWLARRTPAVGMGV
jgi:membrane protease YdiL (CAAX protease family)